MSTTTEQRNDTTAAGTTEAGTAGQPPTPAAHLAELRARFAPHLAALAAGAVQRDASRALPLGEVRALAREGFGALRIPRRLGGEGVDLPTLFELLTDLAAADPNAAQALRGHFAFVEDRLAAAPGPERDAWLTRLAAGELVGNAWTEVGDVAQGEVGTTVSFGPDGAPVVSGRKYYSTGTVYADLVDVYAQREDTGEHVIAAVPTDQAAVIRSDDWNGFGQRTTGTGTTVFERARVAEAGLIAVSERFAYQTAFYQEVLLAVLAGIAEAATRDAAAALARRNRNYTHAAAAVPAADPQLLAVVGELSAGAFAARATVRAVAVSLQGAYDAALRRRGGLATEAEEGAANDAAEADAARGQVALSPLVPRLTSQLFDVLGASGTDAGAGLDRHWRNARTAASHNPWLYKARIVGDEVVNGVEPPRLWAVGRVAGAGPGAGERVPGKQTA